MIERYISRTFLFIACCLFLAPPESLCQILPFHLYAVKDGLVSHDIQTLYQDSRGYLWIGTTDGISVFNGKEFKNYTIADGLPRGFIRQIIEIREKSSSTIWAMTQDGSISRLQAGRFQNSNYDSTTLWGHRIKTLRQDHSGTIWAAMEDTIAQIVSDTVKLVSTGIRMKSVFLIVEQPDSLLWFGCRSGLVYYSFRSQQFKPMDLGLPNASSIADLSLDEDGNLWVGLREGYIVQVRNMKVVDKRRTPPFDFLVNDREGNLWFGTYSGLYRLSKDGFSSAHIDHFTVENGLAENTLKTAFVDREDNLWIGGISSGLAKLSEKSIYRFPLEGMIPTYHYSVGAADSNNHIWVVSPSGLWEIWENPSGRWRKVLSQIKQGAGQNKAYPVFYVNNVVVKEPIPYSIFTDHLGRLWIGYSNAQLACYQVTPGTNAPSQLHLVRTFRPGIDFPDGFPICFIVDKDEMVWYSVSDKIVLLDPNRSQPLLRIFGEREGLPAGTYIRTLFKDASGNVWAGFFNKGVARLDADSIAKGSFDRVSIAQLPPNQKIASITQAADGNMWIATESSGFAILENGVFKLRSMRDGLPSNIVTSMTEDTTGRVWVCTNLGVAYFDRTNSTRVHRKNELIGLAVYRSGTTKSGLLWFVTSDGLVTYDPRNEVRDRIPPTFTTRFQVNDRERPIENGMKLSYDENRCVIDFVAISFREERSIRYQYRLSGIDRDWQPPVENSSVIYAALEPGDYKFEVRAVNENGLSSEQPALLVFSIAPPFWKTWWFTAFLWVAALASVGGTIRFIEIRKLHRKLRALEHQQALDRERLRISQDMHDEVGARLTEIAILGELARKSITNSPVAETHIQSVSEKAREVIDNIGEIIWAINPKNDLLENLAAYLRHYTLQYLKMTPIKCRFESPDMIPDIHLSAEARRNIFLVVKETLHNIVKHSAATNVEVSLVANDEKLEIVIVDNGRGFSAENRNYFGNGLNNMERRAKIIGGTFEIQSHPGNGIMVRISVPI